jgi:hypothetical protein
MSSEVLDSRGGSRRGLAYPHPHGEEEQKSIARAGETNRKHDILEPSPSPPALFASACAHERRWGDTNKTRPTHAHPRCGRSLLPSRRPDIPPTHRRGGPSTLTSCSSPLPCSFHAEGPFLNERQWDALCRTLARISRPACAMLGAEEPSSSYRGGRHAPSPSLLFRGAFRSRRRDMNAR